MSRTSASDAKSAWYDRTRSSPPASRLSSSTVAAMRSGLRPCTSTVAPDPTSPWASARPSPSVAPVTSTVRPAISLEPVGAADHVEHHFVGSRPDPVQAHVAPGALDSVLLHVAGAAVDLQALIDHLARHPGGVELCHR